MEAKTKFMTTAGIKRWHRNTDLCVDLKTLLRTDTYARTGKTYHGLLRRDSDAEIDEFRARDAHYTFIETAEAQPRKRNPHVYRGRYITVTRRDDGQLRPNFRPTDLAAEHLSVPDYAVSVANELLQALEGLIER